MAIKHKKLFWGRYLLIFALIVLSLGVFWYFLARKTITTIPSRSVSQTLMVSEPPNSLPKKNLAVIDGSVYKINDDGTKSLLLDPANYVPGEYGLISVDRVKVSPDGNKILLWGYVGVSSDELYYTQIDNIQLKKLSFAEEAIWSSNSRYFIYNGKVADAGSTYRLSLYDTISEKEYDLSKIPLNQHQNLRKYTLSYSELEWLKDDLGIKVHYRAFDDIPYGNVVAGGEAVILLEDVISGAD